ncbi:hypothetical protein [Iningainema tapete]|uniref:Uncharacterized protein n=1 Tax=Iningainema tapete BLCC-T55 TaxID=2748662 RepID=A0A8J7C5S4_9CYAN|nr:hypothetical protein [Iningainema tapete]MBD2771136.1 hypothetical protein [Iningainema tapete BLCC-T55]
MSKTFQVGAGNKVKLFVALLPLGDRTEPTDVTSITASSGLTAATTSITVTALTGAIAGGTPLEFDNGTDKVTVYLAKDAKLGDTELIVEPIETALSGSSTATYTAKLRLFGGTQLNANINSDRADVLVFEDALGYKDGAITGQSWELPWTANLLSSDEAFRRVAFAAATAVSGREVYVWQEDPPPAGHAKGDGLKGSCVVMNFQKNLQSTAICQISFTLMGQGSPTITRYSLT